MQELLNIIKKLKTKKKQIQLKLQSKNKQISKTINHSKNSIHLHKNSESYYTSININPK